MTAQHELPEFKDIIGGYPECNRYDGYLMITRWPWFFCDNHKTKWWLAAQECSQQETGGMNYGMPYGLQTTRKFLPITCVTLRRSMTS